ncbi:50S ribosomal protein L11 methyltransferase [Alkaliphilus sp. MSJ-5]|uniref:Ribosomal protein L11 methyltransferase n=1 Tax=Alkaliphilus flagellatus TaxID=2841507 RepID=A0ABS6G003_9FIRM|nr:50S ribosomal protein L11 methyltransferase [Alkaliphilus flagellatus]MBU5675663.1 50S ribosomal protein L11 methyltransferase [Alkaliphilus flagellatus]
MKWIEVSIKTTTEAVEAVANVLYDAGVSGVVIEDPYDIILVNSDEKAWDYVDESLIDLEQGAIVKGYIPESSDLVEKIDLIKQSISTLPEFGLNIGTGEVSTLEVNEEDWSTSWKKYYKPTKIGKDIVIKPTWEQYEAQEGEIIIEMDPGMAFGTGTHETTMMCVQQLEERISKESTVFDIGCGSGILSIVAAKLGAEKVIGVDFDEVAVNVAKKNVIENKVDDAVEIRHGNLMDVVKEKADIVVANIIADIIILLSKDIKGFLNSDGLFIASGIILDKIDEVKKNLAVNGLEVIQVETLGEWAVIVSKVKGE